MRTLVHTAFLIAALNASGQYTLTLTGDISGYCFSKQEKDLFNVSIVLNDTTTIESIVDTNYFTFHIPKFLVAGDIHVHAFLYSRDITKGSLCYPTISDCSPFGFETLITKDQFLTADTIHVSLDGIEGTSCWSWETFYFEPNCHSLECLHYGSPNDSLDLTEPNMALFCFVDWHRDVDSLVILAHSDSTEQHPIALSRNRGESFRELLITYGLDPTKLHVADCDWFHPNLTDEEIARMETIEEKAAARKYNSFVHIKGFRSEGR